MSEKGHLARFDIEVLFRKFTKQQIDNGRFAFPHEVN